MPSKAKSTSQRGYRSALRKAVIHFLKTYAVESVDLLALFLETKYKGFRTLEKGTLRKVVSSLVKAGDFEVRSNGKYCLTNQGVIKALPEIKSELTKDGKVRVLVFDIPEARRGRRDAFRRHIKLLGFKKHQQSVWVSRYDCENWITKIIEYHKVGDYVSLYIGKHIW